MLADLDAGGDWNLRPKMKRLQSTSHADPPPGNRPRVVAAVWSEATLRAAAELTPHGAPDLLELRVDAFAPDPARLDALAAGAARPLIVTVRHPGEGGLDAALDLPARRRLYERFLPAAAWVDIELRSLRSLAAVVAQARERGGRLIASFHDFQGTPSTRRLRALADRAAGAGADVCKIAATTRTPGDLARLLDLLERHGGPGALPLAVMGMGPLGKASRPALAAAGSVLNYGYLGGGAQVPGQWPAAQLRARIDELPTDEAWPTA